MVADWKRLSGAADEIMSVLTKHSISILEAKKIIRAIEETLEGQTFALERKTCVVPSPMDVRP